MRSAKRVFVFSGGEITVQHNGADCTVARCQSAKGAKLGIGQRLGEPLACRDAGSAATPSERAGCWPDISVKGSTACEFDWHDGARGRALSEYAADSEGDRSGVARLGFGVLLGPAAAWCVKPVRERGTARRAERDVLTQGLGGVRAIQESE